MLHIGMVGLDTSHCIAFTRILNDPTYEYHLGGGRVVAAYAGGSDLFSKSRERVQGFTSQLTEEYGVRVYDSIGDLANEVDAILMESVDGRQHLEQFRQMAVGKPVFIDKPLATSTQEARQIIQLAESTQTPILSCSSLRFAAGIATGTLAGVSAKTTIQSCEAFGPAPLLEDYPDLFWYGIHGAEILYSMMGTGCRTVRRHHTAETDVVTGEWQDGRVGILKGTRFAHNEFGCLLHTDKETLLKRALNTPPYYTLLLERVLRFFQTGRAEIGIEETFEIIAFLEAATQSMEQNGRPIPVETR